MEAVHAFVAAVLARRPAAWRPMPPPPPLNGKHAPVPSPSLAETQSMPIAAQLESLKPVLVQLFVLHTGFMAIVPAALLVIVVAIGAARWI